MTFKSCQLRYHDCEQRLDEKSFQLKQTYGSCLCEISLLMTRIGRGIESFHMPVSITNACLGILL